MFKAGGPLASFEDDGKRTESEDEIVADTHARKMTEEGRAAQEERLKRAMGSSKALGTQGAENSGSRKVLVEDVDPEGGAERSPLSPQTNLEAMKLEGGAGNEEFNLDSEDDELDFLRKDVDFEARARARAAHKAQIRADLTKNYDRKYPVEHFETFDVKKKKKVKAAIGGVKSIFQKAIDERLLLEKEKANPVFAPEVTKPFPAFDK